VLQTGFRHEAMLYASQDEFLDGTTAFIREAVANREPVLVVVDAAKIAALEERLESTGPSGHAGPGDVTFADMATVGQNPARIIPAWHDFVDRHRAAGRPMRGIGEPIWPGRSPTELVECRQHEALLNLAFADTDGFTLLCPYDVARLDPGVIEQAQGTHPAIRDVDGRAASGRYDGVHPAALLAEPLDPPPADAATLVFEDRLLPVRRFATDVATTAGFGHRVTDVALVVGELATNSLRHGGGRGTLRVWSSNGTLLCEVADHGEIVDPMIGRRRPSQRQLGGRGLWLVNQLCDLVQIRSNGAGSTVRAHLRPG
jgi:anti-sigma regulatory factor (Ser/Thr protein kinase)